MTGPEPVVPDEAVEAVARTLWPLGYAATEGTREGRFALASEALAAAAPFIVAANQPEPETKPADEERHGRQ